MHYSGQEAEALAVETEGLTHFARYMVRKREMAALIRFVRSDVLADEIGRMDRLAKGTARYAASMVKASFEAIKTNASVQAHFADRLQARLGWWLGYRLTQLRVQHDAVKLSGVRYKDGMLELELDYLDEKSLKVLNTDSEVLDLTRNALRQIARYEGDFVYDLDIPF